MNAASPLLIPNLVATLLFTFVLVVLRIWVKHLLVILLCSGRLARQNDTPNRRIAENRSSIESSGCMDSASASKTEAVKKVERNLSAQAPLGVRLLNAPNGSDSYNEPPNSPDSTTTLTRHFGWPLEPMRIDYDPSNQDAGGLVEGSGIHLQLYINAARTIITGANFSSVTTTGEQADTANDN